VKAGHIYDQGVIRQTHSHEGCNRGDAGSRPTGAAQATAYGASHLDAVARRASRLPGRGSHRPAIHPETKQELGGRVAFVPQSYDWGQEAQVDWFEAVAKLEGEPRKLQFFAMRSMASGDAFHWAYLHATQQALLEAHELAFAYFGGVFRTLRYDNMGSLVKKILRGRQRIETDRVIAFRSHWGYSSEYCNPAKGNEKGGVEGELGWFRRNCLTPVPEAESLAALNEQLLNACTANRSRTIHGREMTVGEASDTSGVRCCRWRKEGFPYAEVIYPLIVDGHGRVKVKTNWYSAPLSPGWRATAVGGPSEIEIRHNNRCAARHSRRASWNGSGLKPDSPTRGARPRAGRSA
jgi:transposase